VSDGSFARRHHFNSWLSSVISIPGITMNLQLSISCGSSLIRQLTRPPGNTGNPDSSRIARKESFLG